MRAATASDRISACLAQPAAAGDALGLSRCPRPRRWRRTPPSVLEANGFRPRPAPERPLPAGIRHVVLIVKENRTYDEVFGDMPERRRALREWARLGLARLRRRQAQAAQHQRHQRHAEPPRDRSPVGLQRQLLCRFRRQRGRPSLAGRLVSERLDGVVADGGVRRAEEGLPPRRGARPPAVRRARIPPCIRRSNWRAARSGITSRATASRSTISARASNWPASTRTRTWSRPARAS